MKKNILILLVFSAVALTWSCQKVDDLQNVEVVSSDPEFAFPLINTNVSLNDIFGSKNISALRYDQNGGMILHYEGQVGQKNASDFFTFFSNVPFIMQDSSVTLPYKKSPDLDVKKVRLKSGAIRFGCNAAGVNVLCVLTLHNICQEVALCCCLRPKM
jgi:hypothetical protein